jgi:hypothetical protein
MLLSLGQSLLLLSTYHKMNIFILKKNKKYYFYFRYRPKYASRPVLIFLNVPPNSQSHLHTYFFW